ncbi:pentapeptide repeat-containing protein [Anabaena azotica]|uniref:Pentapeptide repeat-containing protein n=1 Tax=Anabaena azotica FACHB-119 TaxID=947527 RepID=A0ABR8DE12_9NOST|nr:pentapeptide repeat-containing protein [Anabaena azotica]MBD2505304.1 pentapeptide repeat-containing protein [Anabaena azotica FACHB-119]
MQLNTLISAIITSYLVSKFPFLGWILDRKQAIIKYGILAFFVAILIIVMLIFIPEEKGLIATILKNIEGISIFTAAVLYILESGDRQQRKHYEAWKVIDAAYGKETSRARFQALRDLHEDGVFFGRLELSNADLSCINLSGIDLSKSCLNNADLTFTNFINAKFIECELENVSFIDADLICANFRDAYLNGAKFNKARLNKADFRHTKLGYVDFTNADLTDANFCYAHNLTPEQIKKAKNWEKAKYDKEFCAKLGLTSEPAK